MASDAPARGPEEPAQHPAARLEGLISQLEEIDDPRARRVADDLLAAVIGVYGEGLERILELVDEAGDGAEALRRRLADDGVVASLLLIHGLYPVDIETRVGEALDSVRPYMESHGGNVELVSLESGVARIRLEGSCKGCAASSATLELAIKQAIADQAPDLEGLEVEGVLEEIPAAEPSRIELPVVQVADGAPAPPMPIGAENGNASFAGWQPLAGVDDLGEGELRGADVVGARLLVANVDGSLLAYRSRCAACGAGLDGARLADGTLHCDSCGHRYDLPRAGRSLDDETLQLGPVPLLAESGEVRVSVPA